MKEFITLLAIGYGEIGFEDLSVPPQEEEDINPKFQKWVEDTFSVKIPATGGEIVDRATKAHEDFPAYVASVPE